MQHPFWVVLLLNLVFLPSLFASSDIVVHDSVHIESGLDVWWPLVDVVAFWCTVLEIGLCESDPVFRQSSGSIDMTFGDPTESNRPFLLFLVCNDRINKVTFFIQSVTRGDLLLSDLRLQK